MRIIVCIKQVPGTTQVEIDEKTGVLKRDGVPSKMNPFDLFAIESALKLKAEFGGSVSVLTMGPPQAESVIREAYMMGADAGYMLSDRAFGGSDVLATSYALSQGIRRIGAFDLIVCGRQTTDGDTAQVGAELAEFLDIPHVANVTGFTGSDGQQIEIEADVPLYKMSAKVKLPCLLTVEKGICEPRLPSYRLMKATADRPVTCFKLSDLPDADPLHYGLNGSPTRVKRIFQPPARAVNEIWRGTATENASKLLALLRDKKFTGTPR